jgi:beta-glucosidase
MMQVERADTTPSEYQEIRNRIGLKRRWICARSNTPDGWAKEIERFQKAALDTRLGIPLYGERMAFMAIITCLALHIPP